MASVYQAINLESGQQVVVKVFQSRFQTDPGFAIRFREHLKTLVELNHENLLTILDYGLVDGQHYIAMEDHHGLTLRTVIAEQGTLSPSQAMHISQQICAAMNAIHGQGLVHRDLKPENVLLLADGQVKVTDVGLTSLLSETGLSKTDVMLAGVGYMSPEQARGNPVGLASDIYNIGILLFEMLTGRLPFESSDAWKVVKMHAQDPPPSAHDINPKVPAGLSRIVDQALQKDSSGRFASAAEMEMVLAELPQSEGFWWHWLPARIKTSEGFSLQPLLASLRQYANHNRQLGVTFPAVLQRISPTRRALILHYLASFLIAFTLLFFLSGHLLDSTSQAADDNSQVQLMKTAPEIDDGREQPSKIPSMLSSQNSTVPSSLLIGQENATTEPEDTPNQGVVDAVPAGASGGNPPQQANDQGDGEKGGQGKAKGNDNGKENGQDNRGKGNNNGKGNEDGKENKGKGNNNDKGKGQDNKGKGNNNGKGGKK
jgi:serine/threonine protein kinase